MAEKVENFDPYSFDELSNLLPDRCRNCTFANFVIGLSRIDKSDQLGPMAKIKDIEEKCSGHEGSDPSSEYYSEGFDRSGCPYIFIRQAEGGR